MPPHHKRCPFALIGLLALGCSSNPSREGRSRELQRGDQGQPHAPRPALSDTPSDGEFLRLGSFALPLVPAGSTTRDENRALARALMAYEVAAAESGADAVAPLTDFLQAHRDSAWKPALLVNLGTIYRQTGHFSKALESWQSAWESTKRLDDPHGRALADAAVGQLYQMAFRTPAASIVAPALVHWKVGHYAAIVDTAAGRYRVQDSAFGEDILVSPTTLDEEASGYFLIPNGPLPEHWRKLGASEAGAVWGRGTLMAADRPSRLAAHPAAPASR